MAYFDFVSVEYDNCGSLGNVGVPGSKKDFPIVIETFMLNGGIIRMIYRDCCKLST